MEDYKVCKALGSTVVLTLLFLTLHLPFQKPVLQTFHLPVHLWGGTQDAEGLSFVPQELAPVLGFPG